MLPSIPGQRIPEDYQDWLRHRVAKLFGMKSKKFPGCQPVSFASRHLKELETENYFVSEKADGIRCLLFTYVENDGWPRTFLIDRKNDYYEQNFGLPQVDEPPNSGRLSWLTDTVLDGELVLDVESNGETTLWFLLFDCMICAGKSLIDRPYHKRLGHLTNFIKLPFDNLLKKDPTYAQSLPFKMDLKKLQLSYGVDKVFAEIPKLKHKSDGIIYTASNEPYGVGTFEKMIKWKPSDENTVDFRVEVRGHPQTPRFMLQIWEGGYKHTDLNELVLEPELQKEWATHPPQGRIVECRYDPEWPNHWRFMRFRDDKTQGNHVSVYHSIMGSIEDNVDRETIVKHIPIIRDKWKQREREEQAARSNRPR